MAEKKDPPPRRVSWETVASLGIVVGGTTTALIFAPQRAWDVAATLDAAAWAGLGGVALGIIGLVLGRAIVRRDA